MYGCQAEPMFCILHQLGNPAAHPSSQPPLHRTRKDTHEPEGVVRVGGGGRVVVDKDEVTTKVGGLLEKIDLAKYLL